MEFKSSRLQVVIIWSKPNHKNADVEFLKVAQIRDKWKRILIQSWHDSFKNSQDLFAATVRAFSGLLHCSV